MALSPYVARLREKVGNDLLLLPSVAVLPWDTEGRLLLVRTAGHGRWQTLGGPVEVDESPADAATRGAHAEAGIKVSLGEVVGVLGGPQFRTRDPNGDEAAHVTVVYEAAVPEGTPATGDSAATTTTEVAWVSLEELDNLELEHLTQVMFTALGLLAST
jgi:ADP-ribose pyrophosphatase YjhB (NUDIX family)